MLTNVMEATMTPMKTPMIHIKCLNCVCACGWVGLDLSMLYLLLPGPGIDHREASAEGGAIVLGLLVVHTTLLND